MIDNHMMLDIMPMLQDVEIDLMFVDLEVAKDFKMLQSLDIWITNTSESNNGKAHKQGMMN